MSARDRILGRLRAAPKGVPVAVPKVAAWHAARPPIGNAAAAIELFRKNITAARAEVHDTTAQDWPLLLARLAAEKA